MQRSIVARTARACPKCGGLRTVVIGKSPSPRAMYLRCTECGHVSVVVNVGK